MLVVIIFILTPSPGKPKCVWLKLFQRHIDWNLSPYLFLVSFSWGSESNGTWDGGIGGSSNIAERYQKTVELGVM